MILQPVSTKVALHPRERLSSAVWKVAKRLKDWSYCLCFCALTSAFCRLSLAIILQRARVHSAMLDGRFFLDCKKITLFFRIIGICLQQMEILPLPLCRHVLKFILNRPITWYDLVSHVQVGAF